MTSTVIYSTRQRAWGTALTRRVVISLAGLLGLTARPTLADAQWRVAAPAATSAWYAALDSVRLPGAGAFSFTRAAGPANTPLALALASGRFDVLHFVPLYYPSASRSALADALDDAAGSATPRAPRAQLVVGILRQSIADPQDRQRLTELAALVRHIAPPVVAAAQIDAWQDAWNRRFAAGLAPFLARERLDAGILLVVPSLGPEGRLFAGIPANRTDNLIAVATPLGPDDADGPLFAAVRELCFPLVSRVADGSPAFARGAGTSREAARRTSIAAVRCGADLLELLLPSEAPGYRAHWRAVAHASSDAAFDDLFPPDPLLSTRLRTALQSPAPPR